MEKPSFPVQNLALHEVDAYLQDPARQPKSSWSDAFVVHFAASAARFRHRRQHGHCLAGASLGAAQRRSRQSRYDGRISGRLRIRFSIGNAVTSLRLLGALDWLSFFEQTSLVDAELRRDPMGSYARQDFATRDSYRT